MEIGLDMSELSSKAENRIFAVVGPCSQAVWPVAPRDLYFIATWHMMPNGDLVFIGLSEEDGVYPEVKVRAKSNRMTLTQGPCSKPNACPPFLQGKVRAKSTYCAWIFRALDVAGTRTECTIINSVDLGGSIPQALVDKNSESMPYHKIEGMSQLLESHKKLGTGLYSVDPGRLDKGFTLEDVLYYVNAMHRRNHPKAPGLAWLYDGCDTTTTTTTTTTTSITKTTSKDDEDDGRMTRGALPEPIKLTMIKGGQSMMSTIDEYHLGHRGSIALPCSLIVMAFPLAVLARLLAVLVVPFDMISIPS